MHWFLQQWWGALILLIVIFGLGAVCIWILVDPNHPERW